MSNIVKGYNSIHDQMLLIQGIIVTLPHSNCYAPSLEFDSHRIRKCVCVEMNVLIIEYSCNTACGAVLSQ